MFNEAVQFTDKQVLIKEVENFQGVNTEDINIHFTTMQGLHSRMNNPMENSVTYEDFENQKVVLLSDEAHHINVDTKRYAGKQLSISEFEEYDSWESTVMRIFRSNKENILLEFTATADLGDYAIAEKYKDKLVFDYSLKRFYLDKYSKEIDIKIIEKRDYRKAGERKSGLCPLSSDKKTVREYSPLSYPQPQFYG